MNETLHDLIFGVRRSVRYHVRRRMFFDRLNLSASALSVVFGSAAMAAMLGDVSRAWGLAAAAMVTIISTVNLVVGSSRMARLHSDLARKFIELDKQITVMGSEAASALQSFQAARLDIESEEPPILRVLDTLCHNELMRALGYPSSQMIRVAFIPRLFAQILDVADDNLARDIVPIAQ